MRFHRRATQSPGSTSTVRPRLDLAFNMVSLHGGGGGRIGHALLDHLAGSTSRTCLVAVPRGRAYGEQLAPFGSRFSLVQADPGRFAYAYRLPFDNLLLPWLIRRSRCRALFSLTNFSTIRPPVPHLLLCHHAHLAYPDSPAFSRMSRRERARRQLQRLVFAATLRSIRGLVVQTEVMRDRLLQQFPRPLLSVAVHVLPNSPFPMDGVMPPEQSLPRPAEALWLAPTQYYPHKNLELLLEIAGQRRRRGDEGIRLGITVTPQDHPQAQRFLAATSSPELRSLFVNFGRQTPRAMTGLYARCLGVLHPSLLESQCFGYMEALGFGRPILAGDHDFSRTVCGQAACYLPRAAGAWVEAMVALTRSSRIWTRQVEQGRLRFAELQQRCSATFPRYVELLDELST